MQPYSAPWWLPGGNAQTIWAAKLARKPPTPPYRRERWTTPDGDFVDVDFLGGHPGAAVKSASSVEAAPLSAPSNAPSSAEPQRLAVLFHGLEGSSASHYALAFAQEARTRGWAYAVPHFRGCSGELNHGPRAYHSGDFEEVGWLLTRLRQRTALPLVAVGISLGGNALLRWAQEAGHSAAGVAASVAAMSSPIDLAAAGMAIDSGFNRLTYARMFLSTMKPKALAKLSQHPGLFDAERVAQARTLFEFDDAFTAPLHGFAGTRDYWARASAKPHLARITIPALVLNADNDPFVPAAALPEAGEVGRHVTLWRPRHGGHVGFPAGRFPAQVQSMPKAVADWLQAHA